MVVGAVATAGSFGLRQLIGLAAASGGAAALGSGVGGAASQVGMMPFNAGNNFLGSFFFGYGMILGERMMYQYDWPKVQKRLEKGEDMLTVMEDYIRPATLAVMQEAKMIMSEVGVNMMDFVANIVNGVFTGVPMNTVEQGETPDTTTHEFVPDHTRNLSDIAKNTPEGKRKNKATTEFYANFEYDKSIIGENIPLKKLKQAQSMYDTFLNQIAKNKAFRTQSKSQSGSLWNQYQTYRKIRAEYTKVINYMLSNNLTHSP